MPIKAPVATMAKDITPAEGNGNHFFVEAVSPAMRAIERVLADIAPTDIPVLIVGESGTGKEVVARRIHRLSQHRHEAFLKLSCAGATPEAFAGALDAGNGNGARGPKALGTLFLDEVGELDTAFQPKLLQAIPDGDLAAERPSGHSLRGRLICATSRNLEEEMRAGRFREELYYRINGVCLRLPPLRHRKEDIPLLAEYFLAKYAALLGRRQPGLRAETVQVLSQYAWPGNIRELENVMRKIVALGDEQMAVADLESALAESRPNGNGHEALSLKDAARAASRQAERELILKTLARTRWNRKRAAQELQISYKALLYKLKQIGCEEESPVS